MKSEYNYNALMKKIRAANKNNGKDYDVLKIKEAYDVADSAHEGQLRKSGEPYISHPVAVAMILLDDLYMDTDTIVSALLHDVVEDTGITLDVLRWSFGEKVAELVDGVTKIGMVNLKEQGDKTKTSFEEQLKADNIRKILFAMNKDVRVIIIKLADRLHNMRTLSAFRPEKQRRIAHETMNFYAPIAHQLGIAHIKDEMENTALFYLDNFAYKEIEDILKEHRNERNSFIENTISKISERLNFEITPRPVIEGRIKGIYSLYRKMFTTHKELDEIYDLYAIRVIVDTNVDCYKVMGIIHEMFTPLMGQSKDYIATPKANNYQSLHTVVLGREGQPFEVQIRTHEMHNTARFGVASHWRYKLGLPSENIPETKFEFIRHLLEQNQEDETTMLSESVKTNLSPNQVYIFTPKGDYKILPKGSTVIDFAYSVHTEVGNNMSGARINGKKSSVEKVLKTGDVVDIELGGNGPSYFWLNYAITAEARNKINKLLKRQKKDRNIPSGRAYVEGVLKSVGLDVNNKEVITEAVEKELIKIVGERGFKMLDHFYASISYGGVLSEDATKWIRDGFRQKADLFKIKHDKQDEEAKQYVKLRVTAIDHKGLLSKICLAISEKDIAIISNNSHTNGGNFETEFILDIEDSSKLVELLGELQRISSVLSVDNTDTAVT